MEKQLTKRDILNELHGIQNYMEEKDAFHGYGQITDLIKKLENECDGNHPNSKPANCAIFDVSNRRELFDKFYSWLDGLTQEEYDDMSLTDKCEKFFFKT